MNKREMYNRIMEKVAIEVKKAIDESLNYEKDPLCNNIAAVLKNDKKLYAIVKDVDLEELIDVLCAMKKNTDISVVPATITNIKSLATYINYKIGKPNIAKLCELSGKEIDALGSDILAILNPKKAEAAMTSENVEDEDDKKDESVQVKEQKKEIKESVMYRRRH